MPKQILEMEVAQVTQEARDVKTYRLKWPDGVDYDFKTGQFITVYFSQDPKTKRAYSLSSCELDRGFFEISVKRAGNFGARLYDELKQGDKLMVIPPTGRFTLPDDPKKDLILIAGGSGVTPFRGFVRYCNAKHPETRVTILYSARVPEEIIFKDEFEKLARENPNFHFNVTCTRVTPEHAYTGTWNGRKGRITADWVREQIRDLSNTVFYACGPTELVLSTEKLVVEEMKIPKEQMKMEKWG